MSGGRPKKRAINVENVDSPDEKLDLIFGALSHRVRRGMLDALASGPAPVSTLAAPYAVSKAAISKHLKVLEAAGLIRRDVEGRIHRCTLEDEPLLLAQDWISERRQMWGQVFDALSRFLIADDDTDAHTEKNRTAALARQKKEE